MPASKIYPGLHLFCIHYNSWRARGVIPICVGSMMPVSFSFSLTGVNSHRTEVPNLDIMNGSILVLYSLDGKVRSPGEPQCRSFDSLLSGWTKPSNWESDGRGPRSWIASSIWQAVLAPTSCIQSDLSKWIQLNWMTRLSGYSLAGPVFSPAKTQGN